jgi:tetratricopeptide (TPR) repeat protein
MNLQAIPIPLLILALLAAPVSAAVAQDPFTSAGALYSKSVDLANEGKYPEALDAADQALAMNVTALTGLIQSNRAGILVMLHRNPEAIAAADAALAIEGNLTETHSVAWYNKANALRAMGKIPEAQVAYDHAHALDNSLVPPDMSGDPAAAPGVLVPTPQKSPFSPVPLLAALGLVSFVVMRLKKHLPGQP